MNHSHCSRPVRKMPTPVRPFFQEPPVRRWVQSLSSAPEASSSLLCEIHRALSDQKQQLDEIRVLLEQLETALQRELPSGK